MLKLINELMAEAADEVADQGVFANNGRGCILAPLVYTGRCVERSIYRCKRNSPELWD